MATEAPTALPLNNAASLEVGNIVRVQPRTWAGINRLGGQGVVTCVHTDERTGQVGKIDVRYVLGGFDKMVDIHYVECCPSSESQKPAAGGRRRARRAATAPKTTAGGPNQSKKRSRTETETNENDDPNEDTREEPPASKRQRYQVVRKITESKRVQTIRKKVANVRKNLIGLNNRKRITNQAHNNNNKPVPKKTNVKPPPKRTTGKNDTAKPSERRKKPIGLPVVATPDVPRTITFQDSPSSSSAFSSIASPVSALNRSHRSDISAKKTPTTATKTTGKDLATDAASSLKQSGSRDSVSHLTAKNSQKSKSSLSAARALYPSSQENQDKQPNPSPVSICEKSKESLEEDDKKCKAKSSPKSARRNEKEDPSSPLVMKSPMASPSIGNNDDSPTKPNLQSEHLRVMNNASRFIQQVVDRKEPSPTTKALPNDDNENEGPDDDKKKTSVDPELLAEFIESLHELMEQNDDGDGLVEDQLFGFMNNSGRNFTNAQVEELLDHLCQENKIMRSDGLVYMI